MTLDANSALHPAVAMWFRARFSEPAPTGYAARAIIPRACFPPEIHEELPCPSLS